MLKPASEIMADHDVILLEEPQHPDFKAMLRRDMDTEEYVFESGTGFPEFTRLHCSILQGLHAVGKNILQVEPYLEHLLNIQYFLAEGHTPDEIKNGTVENQVYMAERRATGRLIEYYTAAGSGHYDATLRAMMDFARADAARFLLRDKLRSKAIINLLQVEQDTFIEAGPMHQSLRGALQDSISRKWLLNSRSLEGEIAGETGLTEHFLAPGDLLTLAYMDNRPLTLDQQLLLCAQTLIYNKISIKDEMIGADTLYPHLRDEARIIEQVASFDYTECRVLYGRIRSVPTWEARKIVFG